MTKRPRSTVFLIAFDDTAVVVDQLECSYDEFYDGDVPLIDSSEYRAGKHIRRITGEVYNGAGSLQQSFDNAYAADGGSVRGRAVHEDGTIVET